ncbi:hypothetical protein HWD99_01790 [Microbacterium sp. C5A9]|uniref:hypothetical protein n=1 Tax=Microbacterium sp. C5A9 TaxID=2736663 RepID=UPI001F5260FF|nr:hypothetical protein [Microbacterium sp. C5A9]MCI1017349.1 hypothetical protein [Microbacterium sp. C5A9]
MKGSRLLTTPHVAAEIKRSLVAGDIEFADCLITELFGHVINATGTPPHGQLDEPRPTGSGQYDVLLATGFAYALELRGLPAERWMREAPALSPEWL